MYQKLLALGGGGGEKVGLNRDGRWIRTPGGGILSSLSKNLSLEKATVLLALTSCSFDLISSLFFFCRCDSDQCYLLQMSLVSRLLLTSVLRHKSRDSMRA